MGTLLLNESNGYVEGHVVGHENAIMFVAHKLPIDEVRAFVEPLAAAYTGTPDETVKLMAAIEAKWPGPELPK
jgi:hypothetical protein